MAEIAQIQVSRLLDERGLSAFQIKLIAWSLLIVLIDGYDIAAIAFAAPHLVRAWGVSPAALGPVFSASLVGILFGSALFGWIGDRYGRKAALVGSNLLFGVFTLAAAYSTNLDQMFWLRLLAGLGISGVIPNVVAINAESAPRHLRATLAIIAVGFVPIGGAIPGFVAATIVPQQGWQGLFLIGGIVPLVIGVAAAFRNPASTWRCMKISGPGWKSWLPSCARVSRCLRMRVSSSKTKNSFRQIRSTSSATAWR